MAVEPTMREFGNDVPNTPGADSNSRNDLSILVRLAKQGRDVVTFGSGSERTILLNHPDLVRRVLVQKDKYTKDTPPNRFFRTQISDGMLTADGYHWKHQRRTLSPAFADIAGVREISRQCTNVLIDRMDEIADTGEPLNLTAAVSQVTLAITCQLLLGIDERSVRKQCRQLGTILDDSVGMRPSAHRDVDAIREDLLAGIRSATDAARGRYPALARNLLNRDPDSTPRSVDEQLATILLAGYETTANTLSWAWILLILHRHIYQAWLQSMDNDANTARTAEIFSETLRLYPSAWMLGRRAVVDDCVGDVAIPKDSIVAISPFVLHRHRDFWEDAENFLPDRFAPHGRRPTHRYAYIPFGAGPRFCIGRAYALHEANVILTELGKRFVFHAVDATPPQPEHKFVLRAPQMFMITVQRRRT